MFETKQKDFSAFKLFQEAGKKTPENEKKKACEMFNDVKEVMEMERL
ncbi:MAG: hypothetical protein RBR95_10040 [Ignavibacteriaceae bacterium]|nr:hypothetical protein [Ignavibacteriaceae bacterium]